VKDLTICGGSQEFKKLWCLDCNNLHCDSCRVKTGHNCFEIRQSDLLAIKMCSATVIKEEISAIKRLQQNKEAIL